MDTKNGTELINQIFTNITEAGKETILNVGRELVGDKENVTFTVMNRTVQPEQPKLRPRLESPARAHLFHDAAGFAAYLAKYKSDDTVVMVDIAEQTVAAVLDEKAVGGFEIIRFTPMVHPLFSPWERLLETNWLVLKTFVEHLAKNRRVIVEPDGKEVMMLFSQVKASRKIDLHQGIGAHSINGILCELDIAGKKQTQEVNMPNMIRIECPLYVGNSSVSIEIDLLLDANVKEGVIVKTCSADLAEKRVEAFEQMLVDIRANKKVTVALGRPQHAGWTYL